MPSTRARVHNLPASARARVFTALSLQLIPEPYNSDLMHRRRAAIHALVDPGLAPEEAARMRRHLGWPLAAGSARRVWALRHQHRALAALQAIPPPRLP